ncbi:MAG: TlyA family RNA methyltransferase [Anaerofustis stercorihominis]|nr:TlyA family RNA methyltransferase [Anaerofustis stercorihominis]
MLADRLLAESRSKAQAMIMAGVVYVNGNKVDKAGYQVSETDNIEVRDNACPYVSRGGFKLEKALRVFDFSVDGKVAIDVGASSGGFTDCMLQNGAVKVYAVDVGTNQLVYKLRIDERVHVFEQTNFRNMPFELIGEKVDVAVMDVSFISITKLVGNLKNFLKEDAHCVFLIKPQFEADKNDVGKGVITDIKLHRNIVKNVVYALADMNYQLLELDYSPIKGPKGNVEFISHFVLRDEVDTSAYESMVLAAVDAAHGNL